MGGGVGEQAVVWCGIVGDAYWGAREGCSHSHTQLWRAVALCLCTHARCHRSADAAVGTSLYTGTHTRRLLRPPN